MWSFAMLHVCCRKGFAFIYIAIISMHLYMKIHEQSINAFLRVEKVFGLCYFIKLMMFSLLLFFINGY